MSSVTDDVAQYQANQTSDLISFLSLTVLLICNISSLNVSSPSLPLCSHLQPIFPEAPALQHSTVLSGSYHWFGSCCPLLFLDVETPQTGLPSCPRPHTCKSKNSYACFHHVSHLTFKRYTVKCRFMAASVGGASDSPPASKNRQFAESLFRC